MMEKISIANASREEEHVSKLGIEHRTSVQKIIIKMGKKTTTAAAINLTQCCLYKCKSSVQSLI